VEKAALSYTDRGYVEGDLVAVFAIDLALHTLQPFTNDVKAIKVALNRAATQGNTGFLPSARRRASARPPSTVPTTGSAAWPATRERERGLLIAPSRPSTRSRST
jgi:hypothetical protein